MACFSMPLIDYQRIVSLAWSYAGMQNAQPVHAVTVRILGSFLPGQRLQFVCFLKKIVIKKEK